MCSVVCDCSKVFTFWRSAVSDCCKVPNVCCNAPTVCCSELTVWVSVAKSLVAGLGCPSRNANVVRERWSHSNNKVPPRCHMFLAGGCRMTRSSNCCPYCLELNTDVCTIYILHTELYLLSVYSMKSSWGYIGVKMWSVCYLKSVHRCFSFSHSCQWLILCTHVFTIDVKNICVCIHARYNSMYKLPNTDTYYMSITCPCSVMYV
jgi:hypothetical protein